MTPLAPHLSGFLCEYLPRERRASPHTCDTYAYAFQLLVCFAADRLKMQPSSLQIEQLDAPLILDFLHYLEAERQCGTKTRNARLAAINALFRLRLHWTRRQPPATGSGGRAVMASHRSSYSLKTSNSPLTPLRPNCGIWSCASTRKTVSITIG